MLLGGRDEEQQPTAKIVHNEKKKKTKNKKERKFIKIQFQFLRQRKQKKTCETMSIPIVKISDENAVRASK